MEYLCACQSRFHTKICFNFIIDIFISRFKPGNHFNSIVSYLDINFLLQENPTALLPLRIFKNCIIC